MSPIVAPPAWTTVLRVFVAGFMSFVVELLFALADSQAEPRQALLGASAGALLTLPVHLLLSGLLTVPWLFVRARLLATGGSLRDALRAWFAAPTVEQRRAKSAWLVSSALLCAGALFASYRLSLALVLSIVRPPNAAGAIALTHLALAALSVGLARMTCAGLERLAARVAAWRKGKTWLDQPARVALALLAAGVLALGLVAYLARGVFAELHLRPLLAPGCAVLAFVLTLSLLPRMLVRPLGYACMALWMVSLGTPFVLKPSDYDAISLFEVDVASSSLVSAQFTALTDRDRDGHRAVLGGGDCRPDDPRFHPGAPDVPDNKLDEDCDGRDLRIPELFASGAPPFHTLPADVPARPNIVLITVDAFAAGHLKSFGYAHDTAPNIEQLIKGGVLFDRCFAQGPSTRLSFPAMFTSRYDSEIDTKLEGRMPYPLLDSNTTLAELLRKQGYRTSAVLPTGYFTESAWEGITQGFDVVDASTVKKGSNAAFNAELVTQAALKQIAVRKGRAPMFMWVHYFDPHGPHEVPTGMKARGDGLEEVYDAELAYADRHIGRLLTSVQKKLGENTLVVLTGDHGYGFHGKRYARGGYGYDLNTLTLHVPMVFSAPFVKPRRVHGLCGTVDLLPTLLNIAGGKTHASFRGFSLVPEMFSGTPARPQLLFHQEFLPEKLWRDADPLKLVSVRTPDYNYVLDRSTGVASLWKWSKDYEEAHDLLRSGRRDAHSQQLSSLLAAFVYESLKNMKLKKPDAK